jgi:ABC-2 type transport system ATP-binding protein
LLGQVEALCSHVAIIHHGKVVAQGELASVAASVKDASSLEQAFLALTKSSSIRERLRQSVLAGRA